MISARELDIHDLSRPRDGEVDRWVRWAVTVACLVTFLIAVVVPRVLRQHVDGPLFDSFWFRHGLALEVGIVTAFACMPFGGVARSVRLAVVLPLLHLGVMIVAWVGWTMLAPEFPRAVEIVPAVIAFPMSRVLVVACVTVAIAGWLIGRSRRGETIHAIVMIALVDLLLVGLWLPLVAHHMKDRGPTNLHPWDFELNQWEILKGQLESPVRLSLMIVVPPLLGAIAYTWIAIRRRHWLRVLRAPVLWVLGIAWVIAIAVRFYASDLSAVVYVNFVTWLLAAAAVAVAAIAALSVVTWLGARRQRTGAWQQHTGRIAGERGELIAGFEISSWLRGPRAITSACEIVTARGTLPVPAGAQLIAPLPLASTLLRTGERVAIIRGGDEVSVGGYEQHATGQPFRDSGAPIPSEQGVLIGPTEAAGPGQLALVAWRPCVAYLLIIVVVAAPALVTALQPH